MGEEWRYNNDHKESSVEFCSLRSSDTHGTHEKVQNMYPNFVLSKMVANI